MFHETLPPPYAQAWELLRRESHHYGRQFAVEGVRVRMAVRYPPTAWPNVADISEIESVTVEETWITLRIHEILDRVCGMVPREDLHVLESYYRGYNFRHQRQLCPEYEQALRLILEANAPHLHHYAQAGIPVRDSQYFGNNPPRPDDGIIHVGPLEVFKAMHICGVQIPEPLFPFYGDCRQMEDLERAADGPTGPTGSTGPAGRSPWDGTYTVDRAADRDQFAATLRDYQNAYNDVYSLLISQRLQAAPSMWVTGAWDPRGYQGIWNHAPELTPEQRAHREAIAEEYRRAAQETRERAMALLERVVTTEELQSFKDNKYIERIGKKYRYRIKQAGQTALYGLKSNQVEYNACLQLTDNAAPAEDRVVMEYLMIRNEERKYLKTANLFPTGQAPSVDRTALQTLADVLFRDSPIFARLRSNDQTRFNGGGGSIA